MRKTIAITIGVLAIGAPTSNAATEHHVRHRYPFLSTARAERAMVRAARVDQPRQVEFGRCRRFTRRTVRCWITERDAMNLLSDDGAPIAADITWWQAATLRHGHVKVTLY